MEFSIPYGKRRMSCALVRGISAQLVHPAFSGRMKLTAGDFERALEEPLGSDPLSRLVSNDRRRITIVVPDATRKGGQRDVLPMLLNYLEGAGVSRERLEILVANGTHREMTDSELRQCFGERVSRTYRISQHDCRRKEDMTRICSTSSGTELWVNSKVTSSHFVILLGAVSFHYFAGFGGGPKLLFPGVAHHDSVMKNHSLTIKGARLRLHDGCRSGRMEGNPVLRDIWEGVGAVGPSFAINLMYDPSGNAVKAFCGEWKVSSRASYEYQIENFAVQVDRTFPLVIASAGGFPRDIDFVQAHKAMEHASFVVSNGGILLLAASCEGGIGSEKLREWIAYVRGKSEEDRLEVPYDQHLHLALSLKKKTERIKIWMVSDLDKGFLSEAGIRKLETLDQGIVEAREELRLPIRCAVIPHASQILPRKS